MQPALTPRVDGISHRDSLLRVGLSQEVGAAGLGGWGDPGLAAGSARGWSCRVGWT